MLGRNVARFAVAGVLTVSLFAPLGAQTPVVTVTKLTPVHTLEKWPGLTLVADQNAHAVVLAVTRGPKQTAVQVLSPVEPTRASATRRGKRLPVRSVSAEELEHLLSAGSNPMILAFASSTEPDLGAFVQQNRWATNVVLDTAAASIHEVISIVGRELFGESAAVNTTVAEAASPLVLSRQANAFAFIERCENGRSTNGSASTVPNGNVSYTGALGIIGYPDWNWAAGTLISGQKFRVIPGQRVGSACIDARIALYPERPIGRPGRTVPGASPAPTSTPAELKMPAVSDKPVEAIPAHMAPGPVVHAPAAKPPR